MKAYFDNHDYEYVTAGSPNMIGDTLVFIYYVSPDHNNWFGQLSPNYKIYIAYLDFTDPNKNLILYTVNKAHY